MRLTGAMGMGMAALLASLLALSMMGFESLTLLHGLVVFFTVVAAAVSGYLIPGCGDFIANMIRPVHRYDDGGYSPSDDW